jgi:two-component system, LytTR family, sensor kinase
VHFPIDWRLTGLGRARKAVLLFLLWTAFGLCQAVPGLLGGLGLPEFAGTMIQAWCWALLTPAILFADRKLTSPQRSVIKLSLAHLVLSVPFTFAYVYISSLVEYPYAAIWWNPLKSPEYVKYYFLGGWTAYMAFVAALQTLKFYNRLMTSQVDLERVEKGLIEARLNALRLQLEPHFLFNTLNTISSEVVANPELAREVIEDLGALLRGSLDCQDSTEITLAKELALLDHYLAIQKRRFGKRIKIKVDVDPETLTSRVPSMLLQPLVENAIRHGIEPRLTGGTVKIAAAPAGDELAITVADDGVGLPPKWQMENCSGLGLRVTCERLETLYASSGHFSFSVSRRKGGGTQVAIRIPLNRPGGETLGTAA